MARVFFRMVAKGRRGAKSPKAITSFTKAWQNACREAGCPWTHPASSPAHRRPEPRTGGRAGAGRLEILEAPFGFEPGMEVLQI